MLLPLYLDINPNGDVSTTLMNEPIEHHSFIHPAFYEKDLLDLREYEGQNQIPTITCLTIDGETIDSLHALGSEYSDDYDVLSKFHFKHTKSIRGRIVRSDFKPKIVLD